MAKRDVELIIRAKNEASKAVKSIADALDALTANQDKLVKSADKTDSAMSRLGKALGDLDKQFRGVTATAKIAAELDAATASIKKLEGETAKAEAELGQLQQAAKAAAAETARLKQETEQAAAAVRAAKSATEQAAGAQQKLNAEIREAAAERDRLAKVDARLSGRIEAQQAAVEKARTRYAQLAQELANADKPTKTLQKSVEAANTAYDAQQSKLSGLLQKQEANRAAMAGVATSATTLQAKLETANADYTQQRAKLEAVTGAHKALAQSQKTAAANEQQLAVSSEAAAATLERQRTSLERGKQGLADLSATAGKAEQTLGNIATSGGAALKQTVDAQRRSMLEAKREWVDSEAKVKTLAVALQGTSKPSAQMVADFEKARNAARLAKQEYLTQREAVEFMGRALRTAGGDIDTLGASQRRLSQIQAQLRTDLAQIRTNAQQAAQGQAAAGAAARSAAQGQSDLGRAARGAANELSNGNAASSQFAESLRNLYGHSRQAMSMLQRLRGQVLSYFAAFAGIPGAIAGTNKIVDAYTALEAAQSRLNVAFDGNQTKVATELDFIRRTAERLGVEFTTLAQEYGKFAIATKGTNLQGENTRKIFLAVAEAARVARISNDDMKGVFVALTQIVSKGSVQMEELRQQLGDRLPGAIQLMADGLNVGTDQLIKMMEQGKVTSDALIGFADKLNEKYGAHLPEALKGAAVATGELKTALTQRLIDTANGGFMDKFVEFIRTLTSWLKSADAAQFFKQLSEALSALMQILAAAVQHWRLLAAAVAAFIGIKLGGVLQGLAADLVRFQRGMQVSALYAAAAAQQMGTASVAATGLGVAVGRLTIAIRGLLASTGIGLLVTAISVGVAAWGTSTDAATEAMAKHRQIVDAVKNAYDKAAGKVDGWSKKIEGATVTQTMAQIGALKALEVAQKKALASTFGENSSIFNLFGKAGEQVDALQKLASEFKAGKIEADDFIKAVDKIGKSAANERVKAIALALLETAKQAKDTQQRVREMEAVLRILNGTATEADAVLLGLKGSLGELGAGFNAGRFSVTNYLEALDKLKSFLPGLKVELEKLKSLTEIDAAFEKGLAEAVNHAHPERKVDELLRARGAAREAVFDKADNDLIKEIAASSKITADTLKGLAGKEGFRSQAYLDSGGTPTIGFGSTRVNGRPVQMGDTISREDAIRQMIADVQQFAAMVDSQVTVPITKSMRDALISYAYNVGKISKEILQRINEGDYTGAQEAIRNGVNTVKGARNEGLVARRASEAALFGKDGLSTYEIAKDIQDRAQKIEKAITELEREVEKKSGDERQAAINAALVKAGMQAAVDGITNAKGLLEKGNIDLFNRPQIKNEDGSVSTVRSISVEVDGKVALIPTVTKDGVLSDDAAVERFRKTGEHLGLFDNEENAKQFAEALHRQQEKYYSDDAQRIAKLAGEAFDAAQKKRVEDRTAQLELQNEKKLISEITREEYIRQSAKKDNVDLTKEEGRAYAEVAGKQYDLLLQAEQKKQAEAEVNRLLETRSLLQQQMNVAASNGDFSKAASLEQQLAGVNTQLQAAIQNAITMWQAIGGPEADAAILKLQTTQQGLADSGRGLINFKQVASQLADGLTSAFDRFAQGLAEGKKASEAAREAFLQFASDFLRQIAQMIIKQAIFNAIRSIFPGMNLGAGVNHAGGLAGYSNRTRTVDAAWFANAMRFHNGGVPGLGPDEVPIVAKRNEEVLTEDDPRHRFNGGLNPAGGGEPPLSVKVINTFDPASYLSEALNSSVGEKAILNFVRNNPAAFKQAIGG